MPRRPFPAPCWLVAMVLVGCGEVHVIPVDKTAADIGQTVCSAAYRCCTVAELMGNDAAGTDAADCSRIPLPASSPAKRRPPQVSQRPVRHSGLRRPKASSLRASEGRRLPTDDPFGRLWHAEHDGTAGRRPRLRVLRDPARPRGRRLRERLRVHRRVVQARRREPVVRRRLHGVRSRGGVLWRRSPLRQRPPCDPKTKDPADDICVAVGPIGAACSDASECQSGVCSGSGGSGKTCAEPAGRQCFYASGCAAAGDNRPSVPTLLLFVAFAGVALVRTRRQSRVRRQTRARRQTNDP